MSKPSLSSLIDSALKKLEIGEFAMAESLMTKALRLEPRNPRALCVRAIIATERNQADVAIKYIEKALAVGPNMPAVLNNAATITAKFGNLARAFELWVRLVEIQPDFAATHFNLAICYSKAGNLDAAVQSQRRGVELDPNNPWGYSNLGNYLKDAGRITESIEAFREGISRKPNDIDLHCNLAYAVHFDPAYTPQMILEENRRWAKKFTDRIAIPTNYENPPCSDRKIRIGYVSPNFRDHSESYFILPLFRGTDPVLYEIHAYSVGQEDWVTAEFKPFVKNWRHVPNATDDQLAQLIREDGIDVLVDLTMHMAGHRLQLFAQKPAPVQVTWLAYPSTSGLTQIDYRITDPFLESQTTDCYSEKSWFLEKCYWGYEIIGPRPEVGELPADRNSYVTFGCLNHHGKVTAPTLAAWVKILLAVPDSRLILLVTFASVAEELKSYFSNVGIDPERIDCQPRLARQQYMETYQRIDITLDPFPYNGATTTCDALWMGVPVVSWAGTTGVSRAGLSILSNMGLEDLVAFSEEEYVQKAIALANDLRRVRQMRETLRATIESSVVMDAEYFANAMCQAYRGMWQRWCVEQPLENPPTLEV